MTMGPGGDVRLNLRISTDQLADDLAQVDAEISRLQQRMVSAFNRSALVRRGRVARAASIEDVGENRQAWTPELRSLDRQLNSRLQAIERAARRGETRPPLTPQQQLRQAAQQRLTAAARPIEITAKQKFFDDMRQGLMRGLPNVTSTALGAGGLPSGAGGAARLIMGLLGADNPLVGGALAAGAGALALNATQVGFQRQQAALASALVGGPALGDTRTLMGLGLMGVGQGLGVGQGETQGVAQQLASAGMRPGQLAGNVQSALEMTKGFGLQQSDVIPIIQALGTAGGMKAADIANVLRDVINLSGSAAGSVQQFTLGLKAVSAVNAIAGRDVASVAAIQRAVGPTSGINAGTLMAPAMGAFGSQMLGAAGLLGMSPEQYTAAQRSRGGMSQIFGAASAFMRSMSPDVTGREIGLQLLNQAGVLDLSGLRSDQQLRLGQIMQSAGPGQAMAYYRQATAQAKPRRGKPKTLGAAAPTGTLTSWWDALTIGAQNAWTGYANTPHLLEQWTTRAGALARGDPVHAAQGLVPASWPTWLGGAGAHTRPGGAVNHNVNIKVTVQDQRGNPLGHRVDTTRVIAGANTTNRPPYDHPGRSSPPPWTGGGTGGRGSGGGSSGFD